jgi:hypothetical protein
MLKHLASNRFVLASILTLHDILKTFHVGAMNALEWNVVTPSAVVLFLQREDNLLNILIMELTNFVTSSLPHVTGISSPRSTSSANQQPSLELQDHIQQVLFFFFFFFFLVLVLVLFSRVCEFNFVVGRFDRV